MSPHYLWSMKTEIFPTGTLPASTNSILNSDSDRDDSDDHISLNESPIKKSPDNIKKRRKISLLSPVRTTGLGLSRKQQRKSKKDSSVSSTFVSPISSSEKNLSERSFSVSIFPTSSPYNNISEYSMSSPYLNSLHNSSSENIRITEDGAVELSPNNAGDIPLRRKVSVEEIHRDNPLTHRHLSDDSRKRKTTFSSYDDDDTDSEPRNLSSFFAGKNPAKPDEEPTPKQGIRKRATQRLQRKKQSVYHKLSKSRHTTDEEISPLRNHIGFILKNNSFTYFIIILIITDAILSCLMTLRIGEENKLLERANVAFLIVFTVELFFHYYYRGLRKGFQNNWLRFDTFVVLASWIEFSTTNGHVITALRIMRVFVRVPIFKMLLESVGNVLPHLAGVLFLICVTIYVFAVAYTDLFNGKNGEVSHEAFCSLWASLYTLFEFSTLEWAELVRELAEESRVAKPLSIIFICFTSFLLLNLMIGVICESTASYIDNLVNREQKKRYDRLETRFGMALLEIRRLNCAQSNMQNRMIELLQTVSNYDDILRSFNIEEEFRKETKMKEDEDDTGSGRRRRKLQRCLSDPILYNSANGL